NYVRPDGDTGLMAAGGFGSVALVEMFLAAGADPNVPRALDGLTIADINVICAQSSDGGAGMRKSSRQLLGVLAAAGAKIRTMAEIEAIKDARRRAEQAREKRSRVKKRRAAK